MRARTCAFTLVELLVVIGVVALLIRILLPALSVARQSARLAVCGSNLRQAGVAATAMANDHDGRVQVEGLVKLGNPPAFGTIPAALGDPSRTRYAYSRFALVLTPDLYTLRPLPLALASYLEAPATDAPPDLGVEAEPRDVFSCPDEPGDAGLTSRVRWQADSSQSPDVSLNRWDYASNLTAVGYDYRSTQGRARGLLSRVHDGASISFLIEFDRSLVPGGPSVSWQTWFETPVGPQAGGYTLGDYPADDVAPRLRPDASRHRGRSSVLFVDGHVAAPRADGDFGEVRLASAD